MSKLDELLQAEPVVANVGIEALAEALRAQAVRVEHAAWRPPVPGSEAALAKLAGSGRLEAANRDALERMLAVQAVLVNVIPASEAFPEMEAQTLFHAGPPIGWDDASGPMRGAIVGAMLYEGLAGSVEEAENKAAAGEIELSPCHDHHAVGPMAGVISRSMPVFVVRDAKRSGVAYSTLNEGLGKVLRYGAFGPEVIERLKWMESVLGPVLGETIRRHGPLDLRAMTAQALQMGDDGHNRNRAGTSLFLRELGASLFEADDTAADDRLAVWRFIESNDHFVLNLTMAAAKLAADAAMGVTSSSVVVAMARNGTEFGIRLAGTGSRWFTAPAAVADGLFLGAYGADDANPDIGDSSITETVGLGGFAMAAAPAMARFVGGTAGDAVRHTLSMYEICVGEHPAYQVPILEFRGTPVGIDAARVVRTGLAPVINTGIAGRVAGTGQVGAGIVRPPLECFSEAVQALAASEPS